MYILLSNLFLVLLSFKLISIFKPSLVLVTIFTKLHLLPYPIIFYILAFKFTLVFDKFPVLKPPFAASFLIINLAVTVIDSIFKIANITCFYLVSTIHIGLVDGKLATKAIKLVIFELTLIHKVLMDIGDLLATNTV